MASSDIQGPVPRMCLASENTDKSTAPIQTYKESLLVSLKEAIKPLITIVPDVEQMVWIVTHGRKNCPDHLTLDESNSIRLYTLSWTPEEKALYFILNDTLRKGDESRLKPWFLYLKLITTALSKLPSERRQVFRGTKMDMTDNFPKNKTFFWWAFTSCTTSIETLKSEQFLGKTGTRTMWTINCSTGKDIREHSFFKNEDEVLLLPGCQFNVLGILDMGNSLNTIQIEQIHSQDPPSSSPFIPTGPQNYDSCHIENIKKAIDNCQSGKLDLSGKQINDQGMQIVVKQGLIDKQCKRLILTNSGITHTSFSILVAAIHNNQYLEELDISLNGISNLTVQNLASIINSSALKYVNLSENDISDQGTKYLAEMLKTNMKLIRLSLSVNRIGNDGANILASVLTHENTCLEVLNLSANEDITDESIHTFIEMITNNKKLKKLDLRHCDFSQDGETKIRTVANSKRKFELWISRIRDY